VTFEDPGEGEGQGEGQGGDKEEIDAVVVLEALVPWLPKRGNPAPDCPVIQIGPDPLHSATPIRGFPVTVGLTSTVANALPALQAAITDRWREDDRTAAQERRARLSAANDERRRLALAASQHTSEGLADHAWICHCLNEQKLPGDIIMNELGIDRGRDGIGFTEPNSFYGTSVAGGLGWGLPAALGAKLAQPDRTVIATVGDGSYMFANPLACHQMATALNLPILTIVFNNGRWNAVRASTLAVYPDGVASRANLMPLTTLEPAPEYDKVVEACGGHGEKVERAQDLPAALARALKIVRKGKQQVLLNVRCT
jgi:acetolactate synthase-1/2/3 large subunit